MEGTGGGAQLAARRDFNKVDRCCVVATVGASEAGLV